jgi:hypothetical protein
MVAKLSSVLVVACLLSTCKSKPANPSQGLAEFVIKVYDGIYPDSVKAIETLGVKVWYKDSMAIEENASVHYHTDSKNGTIRQVEILNYRFNDLSDSSIYVYKSFSDTAGLISKYSFEDTTVRKIGGWGFNQNRTLHYVGGPQPLPDTIVGKTKYQRLKVLTERNNIQ